MVTGGAARQASSCRAVRQRASRRAVVIAKGGFTPSSDGRHPPVRFF
jgi:hypothetical protein